MKYFMTYLRQKIHEILHHYLQQRNFDVLKYNIIPRTQWYCPALGLWSQLTSRARPGPMTRAGSVSVFGVGIGIRYFRRYFFMSVRYSVSVSVTDPRLPRTLKLSLKTTKNNIPTVTLSKQFKQTQRCNRLIYWPMTWKFN